MTIRTTNMTKPMATVKENINLIPDRSVTSNVPMGIPKSSNALSTSEGREPSSTQNLAYMQGDTEGLRSGHIYVYN